MKRFKLMVNFFWEIPVQAEVIRLKIQRIISYQQKIFTETCIVLSARMVDGISDCFWQSKPTSHDSNVKIRSRCQHMIGAWYTYLLKKPTLQLKYCIRTNRLAGCGCRSQGRGALGLVWEQPERKGLSLGPEQQSSATGGSHDSLSNSLKISE